MTPRRIITGCAAVHPDQRGGQHVARACSGVLVIDDDHGIGVLLNDERSQFKNKEKAEKMLDGLIHPVPALTDEEREALVWLRAWSELEGHAPHSTTGRERHTEAIAVLDRLLGKETT